MSFDAGAAVGTLSLDAKQFIASLAQADKAAETAGKDIDESIKPIGDSFKPAEQGAMSFSEAIGVVGQAFAAFSAVKKVIESLQVCVAGFAEAEESSTRLTLALSAVGESGAEESLTALANELQRTAGIDADTIKQMEAQLIAQGRTVEETSKIISASAGLAAMTGGDMAVMTEQLSLSLEGTSGRLAKMVPALKDLTEEQLRNGGAIDFINDKYGQYIGKTGDVSTALKIAEVNMGDVQDVIGEALAPAVIMVSTAVGAFAAALSNMSPVMKDIFGVVMVGGLAVMTAMAIRAGILTAQKLGLFSAEMAVAAAMAVSNPLLWIGIAAVAGVIAGTTALIASKIKEADALKASSAATELGAASSYKATAAHAAASKQSADYAKAVDTLTIAELKSAEATIKREIAQLSLNAAGLDTVAKIKAIVAAEERLTIIQNTLSGKTKQTIVAAYTEAYSDVLGIIDGAKSSTTKLQEQLIEVNKFNWADQSPQEIKRLEAVAILEAKIKAANATEIEGAEKADLARRESFAKYTASKIDDIEVARDKEIAAAEGNVALIALINENANAAIQAETENATLNLAATYAAYTATKLDDIEAARDKEIAAAQGNATLIALINTKATADVKKAKEEEALAATNSATTQLTLFELIKTASKKAYDGITVDSKLTLEGVKTAVLSASSALSSGLQAISSQYYTNERAKLDDAQGAELALLKERLASGLITQKEYDAAKLGLDKKHRDENNTLAKQMFETEKTFKLLGIASDAAKSIAGWWSTAPMLGPIAGPAFAGTMTIATLAMSAAQASLVNSQQFVPARAEGGKASGLTRVNELGGEIIKLPDNSLVIPNDISRQIANSVGRQGPTNIISVSFEGARIDKDVDIDDLAYRVSKQIADKVRDAV